MNYATLNEVKAGLKIVESDDDQHLALLTAAASSRIRRYLGDAAPDIDGLAGSSGSGQLGQDLEDAFDMVRAATIHLVGLLHQAGIADQSGFDDKKLPPLISAILAPLRKPPLA